jgi:hypothetical protein
VGQGASRKRHSIVCHLQGDGFGQRLQTLASTFERKPEEQHKAGPSAGEKRQVGVKGGEWHSLDQLKSAHIAARAMPR